MLDAAGASNSSDSKPKANKSTSSTKSAQRFWPENIANIHTMVSSINSAEDTDSRPSELGLSEVGISSCVYCICNFSVQCYTDTLSPDRTGAYATESYIGQTEKECGKRGYGYET
jgi:hypothetical protein